MPALAYESDRRSRGIFGTRNSAVNVAEKGVKVIIRGIENGLRITFSHTHTHTLEKLTHAEEHDADQDQIASKAATLLPQRGKLAPHHALHQYTSPTRRSPHHRTDTAAPATATTSLRLSLPRDTHGST